MAFIVGAFIGAMITVLVCGAIAACSDREPHSDAFVALRSERDLYARRCEELEEQVDKLRLECARPQKGEWVMVYHNSRHTTGHIECNQCGWRSGDWTKHNFCPHCGADMRGEEE